MTRAFLVVSSLIAIGIGASLLFTPAEFQASVGIDLGGNVNLLSEIRAPGGFLLAAGIYMMLGVFIRKIAHTSVVISTLIYLSYGFARLLGMAVDGMPHTNLVAATVLEIVIGVLGIVILLRFRGNHSQAQA